MESDEIKIISYDDLKSYTGNFSEENFIENCQFGKVYRGRIGEREVTVKIWRIPTLYRCYEGDNERRLVNEILLHGDFRLMSHPNVAKLIEYCDLCDEELGVVYDFKSLNTLLHFVQKDDFTWQQRIRVAYQLACLLSFLHNPTITQKPHFDYLQYMVLNLSPNHIMLDQDYNPILYDFSLFSGGVLSDRNPVDFHVCGCIGYMDFHVRLGFWDCAPENDIFSFAMILIGLIAKKVFIPEAYVYKSIIEDPPYLQKLDLISDDARGLDEWARDEYEKRKIRFGEGKVSLVDECFEQDPDFEASDAVKITELLMLCMVYDFRKRASSEKIVEKLEKLKVTQRHPKTLGVKQSEYMLRYSSHYGLLKIMEAGASDRVIELLKKYLSHP